LIRPFLRRPGGTGGSSFLLLLQSPTSVGQSFSLREGTNLSQHVLNPCRGISPGGQSGHPSGVCNVNFFFLLLATGFGSGFCPILPGTAGTIVAIPICYVLSSLPLVLYALIVAVSFFLSVFVSEKAQKHWGKKDDRRIVIDEIMGFLITMLGVPATLRAVVSGFILFRFFDIVKPPPIRRLERVGGGYGVVLDDVMAGVYANLFLQLVLSFQLFS